jgi:SRSO17 transposase
MEQDKALLAFEMVRNARVQGFPFAWVGLDAGYGKEPDFLGILDNDGEIFMADFHKDQPMC